MIFYFILYILLHIIKLTNSWNSRVKLQMATTGRNDNTIYADIHMACCVRDYERINELLGEGHKWYSRNVYIHMCNMDKDPEGICEMVISLTTEHADKQGDRFITQDEIKYNNYNYYAQFQPCLRGSLELVRHFEELGYQVNKDSFVQAWYWGRTDIVRYLIETEKFSISDINIEMVRKNNRVELLEYLESL